MAALTKQQRSEASRKAAATRRRNAKKEGGSGTVVSRVEQLRDELHQLRLAVAPDGSSPHKGLFQVLKEADRALAEPQFDAYLGELR